MYYVQLYSNSKHKMKMGAGILTIPPFHLILMMKLYQNTLIRLRLTKFTTISLCLSHIHICYQLQIKCQRNATGIALALFFHPFLFLPFWGHFVSGTFSGTYISMLML